MDSDSANAKQPRLPVLGDQSAVRRVYADILSQAVTGELVGMLNYASMASVCPTVKEQLAAVQHSESERRHAMAFRALARQLGVPIVENPAAPYWKRIRDSFSQLVAAGDLLGCMTVQELMLESFAVALYQAIADATQGKMAQTFRGVVIEEREHLDHAVDALQAVRERDPDRFEAKVARLHDEVMGVLAEMIATQDTSGHCGLCRDACVKQSLHLVGLNAPLLRAKALRCYLQSLDHIGVRGEKSLRWVANLPA